jgi:hypothetical protein
MYLKDVLRLKKSIWNALVLQVNDLFAKQKLNGHVLAYVKDEGNNLSTMTLIWYYFNCVLPNFKNVNSFCRCLLGPCHVQVLLVCHKWY